MASILNVKVKCLTLYHSSHYLLEQLERSLLQVTFNELTRKIAPLSFSTSKCQIITTELSCDKASHLSY